MINKNKQTSLFIYPTYVCSNNCNFCFIDPKLRKRSNDLSLKEIKDNIAYFEKKHLIKDLVLVGGDPLLHKEIIPLMDFLEYNYFRNLKIKSLIIASEALRCSSDKFIDYLVRYSKLNPDFYLALQISLNIFSIKDKFFKQRKKAILNLAKKKINVRFIIVFTKDNIEKINNSIEFLIKIFSKYYLESSFEIFSIEPRLPFLPKNIKDINSELFIPDSDIFLKTFNEACDLFLKNNISFTLRNIPLCYLNKNNIENLDKTYNKISVTKKVIRIDKHHQLNKSIISSYNDDYWSLQKKCDNCYLKDKCNGVDIKYIKEFKYPNLKPFN